MYNLKLLSIRKLLKHIASLSPIALTKNEQYDRLTNKIIKKVCTPNSVCIDVGTNEGKILQQILVAAPNAKHFAFEPIPILYENLVEKFSSKVHVYNLALSNFTGKSNFNLVLSDMAYSGLQKRAYDKKEVDTTIEVNTATLDSIIHISTHISLIKIDVEGAEMLVLQGAIQTIQQSKPIILFEFGKAGSKAYDITNEQMFLFFKEELSYAIFTLKDWLNNKPALNANAFLNYYENDSEFFYVAAPFKQ